ncbi:MAG: alpha/beta hydrolase-fold protein [Candidatus Izemoplasmatales bacterium]|jgi:predicted alpha/beta superfamily hydrolase|nr:alpha/beta hydrolase-fold protein [Candidatus Izemoplasmatales bacterium]
MLETFEVYIPTTKAQRTIRVYVPDTCCELSPCDILFMHDAQNLFDDAMSYHEVSWRVQDAIEQSKYNHLIVVGIDNHPEERMNEYSPYETAIDLKDRFINGSGGKGYQYIDFIVKELLPIIKSKYSTTENYFMAGSSMGAYISMFAAMKYPALFQVIGSFSVASWFNEKLFLEALNQSKLNINTKFWVTVGSQESSSSSIEEFPEIYINNSKHLVETLKNKGIKTIYFEINDGAHNERQWMELFPKFLDFIYKKVV